MERDWGFQSNAESDPGITGSLAWGNRTAKRTCPDHTLEHRRRSLFFVQDMQFIHQECARVSPEIAVDGEVTSRFNHRHGADVFGGQQTVNVPSLPAMHARVGERDVVP